MRHGTRDDDSRLASRPELDWSVRVRCRLPLFVVACICGPARNPRGIHTCQPAANDTAIGTVVAERLSKQQVVQLKLWSWPTCVKDLRGATCQRAWLPGVTGRESCLLVPEAFCDHRFGRLGAIERRCIPHAPALHASQERSSQRTKHSLPGSILRHRQQLLTAACL